MLFAALEGSDMSCAATNDFWGAVVGLIGGGIGWAFIMGFASIVRNVAFMRRLDVARSIDTIGASPQTDT